MYATGCLLDCKKRISLSERKRGAKSLCRKNRGKELRPQRVTSFIKIRERV